MHELTSNQIEVLQLMRKQECFFLANATERAWRAGEKYYIDSRVNIKGVRRKFNKANNEVSD